MTERRPATTIEQLDIHFGYMMAELKDMRERVDQTFKLLAAKQEAQHEAHTLLANEVRELREKVEAHAPRTILKNATELAIGVTAVAAAAGVLLAIAKFFRLLP